jgi:hypothetical protein
MENMTVAPSPSRNSSSIQPAAIDLSACLGIGGFMDLQELIWLARAASTHHFIVEIGSYLGRSTRALGDNTPGKVMAIDDWYGPRDVYLPEGDRQGVYERFERNLRDLISARSVIPLRMDYADLGRLKLDRPPDMIFIDGDHSSSSVRRDIAWGIGQLRQKGGLLCGHDYDNFYVEEAVKELIPNFFVYRQSIWWAEYRLRYGAGVRG